MRPVLFEVCGDASISGSGPARSSLPVPFGLVIRGVGSVGRSSRLPVVGPHKKALLCRLWYIVGMRRSILRMGAQRRSETSIDRGPWVIPGAGRIDRPQALVAATVVLDVLVRIKMDLTVTPLLGTDGYELHDRVNRACATIEAAIRAIKVASDPRAGDNRKFGRPIESTATRSDPNSRVARASLGRLLARRGKLGVPGYHRGKVTYFGLLRCRERP